MSFKLLIITVWLLSTMIAILSFFGSNFNVAILALAIVNSIGWWFAIIFDLTLDSMALEILKQDEDLARYDQIFVKLLGKDGIDQLAKQIKGKSVK